MYTDELSQLSRDLSNVPANATDKIRAAVEYTANGIKDDWKSTLEKATGRGSLGFVPYTVDYQMGVVGGAFASLFAQGAVRGIEAEVGPNLTKKQGPFAGWFERGAVDGVPATNAGAKAAESNEADFEKGLSKAIADAIKEAIS